jgi:hypothetical protein
MDNHEEFLFVGQFCSFPYITKFIREEVMKEYIFLHNLVNKGIKRDNQGSFPGIDYSNVLSRQQGGYKFDFGFKHVL